MYRKKGLVLCVDVSSKAMPDSVAASAGFADAHLRFRSFCRALFLLRSFSCPSSVSRSASRTRMQHPFHRILHTVTRRTIPASHVRIPTAPETHPLSPRQLTSLPISLNTTRSHLEKRQTIRLSTEWCRGFRRGPRD